MKNRTRLFLGGALLLCQPARASIEVDRTADLRFSRDEISRRIEVLGERESLLKKSVREQAQLFHELGHGAGGMRYLWQTDGAVNEKRRRLSEYVKIAIRERLRELESLATQRTELLAEQEWLRIELTKEADGKESPKPAEAFHCPQIPFDGIADAAPELSQDFGTKTDSETGLKWQSLGWWISRIDGSVKSCAAGKVVFSGTVTGRGRVLIVDHGNGTMTLYANLNDDAANLKKGDTVKAGAVLGTPRDRVYFEVRQNGSAINPRLVIPNLKLAKVGI